MFLVNNSMKTHEYINLVHSTTENNFRSVIFPQLVNAYWTSNGESYYPCVVLDDYQNDDVVYIATKSLGLMLHPRKCVFMMADVEPVSINDYAPVL